MPDLELTENEVYALKARLIDPLNKNVPNRQMKNAIVNKLEDLEENRLQLSEEESVFLTAFLSACLLNSEPGNKILEAIRAKLSNS
jgi:hypothetical protein